MAMSSKRFFVFVLTVLALTTVASASPPQEWDVLGDLSSNEEFYVHEDWGTMEYSDISLDESAFESSGSRNVQHEPISIFGQSTESEEITDYIPPGTNSDVYEEHNENEDTPHEERYYSDDGYDEVIDNNNDDVKTSEASDESFMVSGSSVVAEEQHSHPTDKEIEDARREFENLQGNIDDESFEVFGASVSADGHHFSSERIGNKLKEGNDLRDTVGSPLSDDIVYGQSAVLAEGQKGKASREDILARELWEERVNWSGDDMILHGQSVVEKKESESLSHEEDTYDWDEFEEDFTEDEYEMPSDDHSYKMGFEQNGSDWDDDEQAEIERIVDSLSFGEDEHVANPNESSKAVQGKGGSLVDFEEAVRGSATKESESVERVSRNEKNEVSESKDRTDLTSSVQVKGQSILTRDSIDLPDYIVELSDYEDNLGNPAAHWIDEEQVLTGQSVLGLDLHDSDPGFVDEDEDDEDDFDDEFYLDATARATNDGASHLLEDAIAALDM